MPPAFHADVVIAGAGLAGACAALHLSARHDVLLLEAADAPATGASGAAAGLVNPLMGRRAHLAWEADAALAALHDTLARAGASPLFRAGLTRPATGLRQADRFRHAADVLPHHARWLPPDEAARRLPGVVAPYGALEVLQGGALGVDAFVRAALDAAVAHGASIRMDTPLAGWEEAPDHVRVTLADGAAIVARRLVLAVGQGYPAFPRLAALHLHRVKGQTLRLSRPPDLPPLPHLAGLGYVAMEDDALVAGTTYAHDFADLAPSDDHTREILDKVGAMLPLVHEARLLEARAGARVTVPGTRLPMLGPLPEHRRTWVFTGLGAKGLLLAPLLASRLAAYLEAPETIPEVCRVRRRP